MKEKKELRIVSEVVVDKNGNVIGYDPKDFPIITRRCKLITLFLKTGKHYRFIEPEDQ
ncbi:hypothetical protein [Paenibacillus sp. FSL K6-1230]|uniref:hypothetical protein n=1 Tax=Paenibacillus sp. FSL K6-1230 TaxID=2921603 RepID=UPI0030F7E87E